jgi:hypothetical protein
MGTYNGAMLGQLCEGGEKERRKQMKREKSRERERKKLRKMKRIWTQR